MICKYVTKVVLELMWQRRLIPLLATSLTYLSDCAVPLLVIFLIIDNLPLPKLVDVASFDSIAALSVASNLLIVQLVVIWFSLWEISHIATDH